MSPAGCGGPPTREDQVWPVSDDLVRAHRLGRPQGTRGLHSNTTIACVGEAGP